MEQGNGGEDEEKGREGQEKVLDDNKGKQYPSH